MEMQSILGIGIGSNEREIVPRPLNLKNMGAQKWTRLCGLVCAYRLVDVVALLEGCRPNETQVPRSPMKSNRPLYVRFLIFDCIPYRNLSCNRAWPSLSIGRHY